MSLTRSSVAALAAVVLLPASASANGGSCAKPILWKLTTAQIEKVSNNTSDEVVLRRGPVHLTSLGAPLSTGPAVTASSSGPWRICSMSGRSRDGHRWSLPGTYGYGSRTSFATRQVFDHEPERSLSVAYARRGQGPGGCANPSVAYYDSGQTIGDPGATLAVAYSGDMGANALASWSLTDPGSRICRVEGYSVVDEPWAIGRGGTEGSHVMHSGSRIGTHSDPVLYLWIAFRAG
jgi:hypothetical protein